MKHPCSVLAYCKKKKKKQDNVNQKTNLCQFWYKVYNFAFSN